jgi:hypothetical protein
MIMKAVKVQDNWLSIDEQYFKLGVAVDLDPNKPGYFCDFPGCICREENYRCKIDEPFGLFGGPRSCRIQRLCRHHYTSIFDKIQEITGVSKDKEVLYIVEFRGEDPYVYFRTKEALLNAISEELDRAEFNENFSFDFEKKKLEG